jgi:SAM-dependent methyltransferase
MSSVFDKGQFTRVHQPLTKSHDREIRRGHAVRADRAQGIAASVPRVSVHRRPGVTIMAEGSARIFATMNYAPQVYDRNSLEEARAIILTPEVGLTTEERWALETEWLRSRIGFPDGGLVLDIGCGIGRIAGLLTEKHPVLGVDISTPMRAMAEREVGDRRFSAVSTHMFHTLVGAGLRAHCAVAIWTLQHIPLPDLAHMVVTMALALPHGGVLWTMDRPERYVPVMKEGRFLWVNDTVDVPELLGGCFTLDTTDNVPEGLCVQGASLRRWTRK